MAKHSIFARISNVLVPTGHEVTLSSDTPLEDMIRACDDLARAAVKDRTKPHAYAYKVDDHVEYFISKYFFVWPNHSDNEERTPRRDKRGQDKTEPEDALEQV
jgi:hypothetical protein